MATLSVKLHPDYYTPGIPGNKKYNPRQLFVVGGASGNSTGNNKFQDKTRASGGGPTQADTPAILLNNGIVISANAYVFPDASIIIQASYSVKEQLAVLVEKLAIVVESPIGSPLTATAIRALLCPLTSSQKTSQNLRPTASSLPAARMVRAF